MQAKRFVAPDMSRALRMLSNELGEDAILLSSRTVFEGVEVLGLPAEADLSAYQSESSAKPNKPSPEQAKREAASKETLPLEDSTEKPSGATQSASAVQQEEPQQEKPFGRRATDHLPKASTANQINEDIESRLAIKSSEAYEQLHDELQQVREMLAQKLQQSHAVDSVLPNPLQYSVLSRLSQMGLPIALARQLSSGVEGVEHVTQATAAQIDQVWQQCLTRLENLLPIDASNPIKQGGVFSIVGPGGSGKTAAIVKLASQFLLEHSAKDIAIINLDQFSVGGQAVLHGFSKITSIPVLHVDHEHRLEDRIAACSRCRLVLIDTGSLSGNDGLGQKAIENLAALDSRVTHLLTFSSLLDPSLLGSTLSRYKPLSIKSCILTRLDDHSSSGQLLAQFIAEGLPISYLSEGAVLPSHLSVASSKALMQQIADNGATAMPAHQADDSVFVPTVNRRHLDASESIAG